MKKTLLVLFFVLLPFQTQWIIRYGSLNGQLWEYGTIGIYAIDVLFLIVLLLSLRRRSCRGGPPTGDLPQGRQSQSPTTTGWIGGILMILAIISITMADDRLLAFVHILWLLEAVFLAYVVAYSSSLRKGEVRWGFVVGSVVQAFIGLSQFFSQSTIASSLLGWAAHPAWQPGTSVIEVTGERWLRAYASFPHPNIFGGWMAVAIVLALGQYSQSLEKGKVVRVLFLISLVLLSAGLAVSFSRSAWIAAAVGIVALLLSSFRPPSRNPDKKIIFAILTILLSVSAILLPYRHLLSTRINATARLEQQSFNERAVGYQDAFALIRTHPFFGIGMGNFTNVVAAQNPNRPIWSIQPVHNVFLLTFAELGVIGAVLLVLFTLMIFPLPALRSFSAGGFSILLVLALFDHYLWSVHGGLLLSGVIIGFIVLKFSAPCVDSHTVS